ncbi:MAG: HAMP domain-containing protein, partial [Anaerolineae bacterium]
MLVGLLWRWRAFQPVWGRRQRLLFVLLLFSSPLAVGFLGFRLPESPMLTLPGIAFDPGSTPVMVLSALPWVLAGGLLGPFAATGVAVAAGLFFAAYGSHTIFTLLEWGTIALLVSVALQQRFRTPAFRWLRHPLVSVLMVGLLYPLLFTLGAVLLAQGSLASRLDYAFVRLPTAWLAFGASALMGGGVAELLRLGIPRAWGGQPPYIPSPSESSLETRFLVVFVPVFLTLLLVFMLGDWIIAGRAARDMLEKRMASVSLAVADDLPYLLNVGQSAVAHLAENLHPDVQTPAEMRAILEREIASLPFFQRIYVLDAQQQTLLSLPEGEYQVAMTTLIEQVGVGMAVEAAIPVQFYAVPSLENAAGQELSFIATVYGQDGQVAGAVIGRTTWEANPLAQSLLANLSGLEDLDGVGMLVNEDGEVLYHSPAERMLSVYKGKKLGEAALLDTVAPDGSRQLVYYRPVPGTTWGVVLMVPARQAQQIALEIAAPVIGTVFLLAIAGIVFLRVSLRMITGSLRQLTDEAERIAQGQLDHALQTDGADETGRLRRAFERMRLSLKARLDELNRLLRVSQGVASNVRLEDSLQQIL